MTIYLKMKDGTTRVFEDTGAAGGSYCQSMRFETGFVCITDAWGKTTSIPADTILEIEQASERRW